MERWKKYSSNPLERVKIVQTKHSSTVRCINCSRILRSEFMVTTNDSGYQTCPCGYYNYSTLVGEYLWEVRLIKIKPKEPKELKKKKKLGKQLKLQY